MAGSGSVRGMLDSCYWHVYRDGICSGGEIAMGFVAAFARVAPTAREQLRTRFPTGRGGRKDPHGPVPRAGPAPHRRPEARRDSVRARPAPERPSGGCGTSIAANWRRTRRRRVDSSLDEPPAVSGAAGARRPAADASPRSRGKPLAGSHGRKGHRGPRRAAAAAGRGASSACDCAARLLSDPAAGGSRRCGGCGSRSSSSSSSSMDSASASNALAGQRWLATFTGRVYSKRSGGCWYVCVSPLGPERRGSTFEDDGGSVSGRDARRRRAAPRRADGRGGRRPRSAACLGLRRGARRRRPAARRRRVAAVVREAAALRRRAGVWPTPSRSAPAPGQRRPRRLGLDDLVVVIVVVARVLLAPQDRRFVCSRRSRRRGRFPDARVSSDSWVGALAPARRLRVRRRQPRRALRGMWRLIVVGLVA